MFRQMADYLYDAVDEKLSAVGIHIKKKKSRKPSPERNVSGVNDASGDGTTNYGADGIDSALAPFDKAELLYFADIIMIIKIFCVLDLSLKVQMTQCTSPVYIRKLESLLTRALSSNFQSVRPLIDLKVFCLEYGFFDRSSYGGPDSKTEELIRLMEFAESRLDELEAPFLDVEQKLDPKTLISRAFDQKPPEQTTEEEQQQNTIDFLALLDLKKMTAHLGLQQPTDTSDYKRENFPRQIKEIVLRIVNLLSELVFEPEINPSLLVFTAQYRLLSKKKFHETGLFSVNPSCSFDQISSHFMHDGTRTWLLAKIEEWLFTSSKCICWFNGLEGTGKSCVVSAFCKLNQCYVMNVFVFDSRHENGMVELIKSIANSLLRNIPEYVCMMDDIIQENRKVDLGESHEDSMNDWRRLYDFLLRKPLKALFSNHAKNCPRRRLIVVDGLHDLKQSEWANFLLFIHVFRQDFSKWFCILVTCRSERDYLNPDMLEEVEKHNIGVEVDSKESISSQVELISLESKNIVNHHIRDIETFFAACFGDIMCRKKFGKEGSKSSPRYNPDHMALSSTVDKFVKHICGRFSYAQHLLNIFEETMDDYNGQFQCSLIKTFERFRVLVGKDKIEEEMKSFAKLFNAYRQKDGTSG